MNEKVTKQEKMKQIRLAIELYKKANEMNRAAETLFAEGIEGLQMCENCSDSSISGEAYHMQIYVGIEKLAEVLGCKVYEERAIGRIFKRFCIEDIDFVQVDYPPEEKNEKDGEV